MSRRSGEDFKGYRNAAVSDYITSTTLAATTPACHGNVTNFFKVSNFSPGFCTSVNCKLRSMARK
eukprot:4435558-Amphidinium_carterae.1